MKKSKRPGGSIPKPSLMSGIIVPSSKEDAERLIQEALATETQLPLMPDFARMEMAQMEQDMRSLLVLGGEPKFARSDYGEVRAFFAEASKDYDSDLQNPYWSFTHEILKFILTTHIVAHFKNTRNIRLFDAGAGTGNWSRFVLGMNDHISGILFDINADMLKRAHPKLGKLSGNKVRVVEGNLEIPSDYPAARSNLVLCMHNVIGLGRNSDLIIRNLYTYLEGGGIAFLMATNKYHAFNFTRKFRGELEALRVLKDGTVKFKPDMPEMFCYTPQEFKNLILGCGFDEVMVLGYPVTVYPSYEDTKLLQKDTLDTRLRDPAERAKMLDIEKRLCLNPWLAYRGGSSLIAIAKKKKM